VTLPCAVGDKVWVVDTLTGKITKTKCVDIYDAVFSFKGNECSCMASMKCFGKTVFLTLAEAEAAKEAQG
jgi:hypothetical protein